MSNILNNILKTLLRMFLIRLKVSPYFDSNGLNKIVIISSKTASTFFSNLKYIV